MQISTTINMHNKFDVQLIDSKTNEIKQQCTAYNVVLNTYYSDQSKNVYTPLTTIALGTGTGTPAVTDTALFRALITKSGSPSSLTHIIDDNIYKFYFTITVTFNESEANGDLTEIGLGSKLYTHAMFTDSEGATISIHKTNNDRLTVTATVYITFTFPNDVIPLPVRSYTELAVNKAISDKYTTLEVDYTPSFIIKAYRDLGSNSHAPSGISLDYAKYSNRTGFTLNVSSAIYQDPVYRYTTNRLLASSGNLSTTWQAFAIHTPYCIVPLPNHNIFEPTPLTLETTADGSTTDFNFGIPELMVEGTQVYVNDTLMSPSTYTFYGKDFSCRQAWVSQHGTYLTHHDGNIYYATSSTSADPACVLPIMSDVRTCSASQLTLYYDFRAPYTVNALKHEINGNCTLSYSTDNINWTEVTTQAASVGNVYKFSPITARYWKTYIPSIGDVRYNTGYIVQCTGAFDNMQPQLKFNNPPAANAVVKIITKSEYPIKNENWIIEPIVFDVTMSRA